MNGSSVGVILFMEKAYKKLGTNIGLFAISSFGTKIINFLLVPLYTSYLSTAEYGTVDMLTTIAQLLLPIFSLDIADSVIRFTLDKHANRDSVLLTAVKTILLGSALLIAILFVVTGTGFLELPSGYLVFIFLSFFLTSIYNSLTSYFRGCDKIVDIVIAGIISTLVNGLSNVLFLVGFHWGMNGYIYANILGILVPVVFLLYKAANYGFLKLRHVKYDKKIEQEMLKYSIPLIVNALSWWINNSLDRIFVISICGVDANGLLAVSYKIPSILAMFQTIFNQAWTMSAIQEFDPEDKQGFFSKTYSSYSCLMIIVCSGILLFNVPMAKFLYAKDFFQAWQFTGVLVIAHFFSAMSICVSGVFNAVKDTKTLSVSTIIGAIINIVLNTILIVKIGVMGGVIATLVSNIIVWIWRIYKAKTYIKLRIHLVRDSVAYVLLIIQCIVGLSEGHMYIAQIIFFFVIAAFYWREISTILEMALKRVKSK